MGVIWRDPPARARRSHYRQMADEITAQLKTRPFSWAEVWRGTTGYGANRLRTLLAERECETAGCRGDSDAERIVFARYAGGELR